MMHRLYRYSRYRDLIRAVDRYTSGYNGAGVSAPSLESGSQRSLFVGPYLHSGIHGLGNTAPLTAVGWSKGNELACPPGR